MSEETNIAAQTAFAEAVNNGDLDAIDHVVAHDSIDHDPASGQVPGPEGYKVMFAQIRSAFPDLHVHFDHLVSTDEELAFACTVKGTNLGEFMGHAPTGKKVSYRGMQISRFVDGKLVERWGSSDELSMLQQLGFVD